ncbi:MAG: class B sortase [Oscillospiraceae bacterium]|nr:class B sortase [Oscillospiraceae bacterium]
MASKKSKKSKQLWATAGICAAVLVVLTGAMLALNHNKPDETASMLDTDIPELTESETVPEMMESPAFDLKTLTAQAGDTGMTNQVTGLARSMKEYNADSVGWISIAGTKVNNPIVKSNDDAYYLDMGYNHEKYRAGTVFLDFRNVMDFDQNTWSANLILYGHNMANNEMFGSLRRYRQDLEYYKDNQFIEIDSNYEHATYVIFALPITYGGADAEWRYWDQLEFPEQADFDDYIQHAREKSLVAIDNVDVQYGDKLITLSTCYSDEDDSRFLVIGRKLREGETAETFKNTKPTENSVSE